MKKYSCRAEEQGKTREHPPPIQDGEAALEYLLPVGLDDMRERDASIISPWFSRFLDKDEEDIRRILENEWSPLPEPVATISSFLSKSRPRSIYFSNTKSNAPILLGLDDERLWNRYSLLAEPAILTNEELNRIKKFKVKGAVEFVTFFHELHMSLSAFCMRLGTRAEILTEDCYAALGEWDHSMIILNSMAASFHILRLDGTVGDWDATVGGPAINGAILSAMNFDEFLKWYCTYREKGASE